MPNATPRLSRVLTVAALHHYQLISDSIVSFPGMNYVKQGETLQNVLKYIANNPELSYLLPSVEHIGHIPELKIDGFEERGNALVTKVDPSAYERTFFSVVTESDFSDGRIDRVTEKLPKAFCMGHPAIVVGNPHSIKFMTDFGFQDWQGLFDRHGDEECDPPVRLQLILRDVLNQVSRIRRDPNSWLDSAQEVSAYNLRHSVSGNFLRRYINDVERRVVQKLAQGLGIDSQNID